jgi:uncharacterized protein (DUF1800 family)
MQTEHQPNQLRQGLLERRTTRRALLAGTAAVAAAGTTAVVLGAAVSEGSETAANPLDPAPQPATADAVAGATTKGALASQAVPPVAPLSEAQRRAAHLLRRAGFGGTMAEIDAFAKLSREEAADQLLNFDKVDNSALESRLQAAGLDVTSASFGELRPPDMIRWWLVRMAYTKRPLEERMTLVWHGWLTSQVSKIGPLRAKLMVRQNQLYRQMALPKYDDLVKAASKDPAMLIYLDTEKSTKEHPNENYARELMELFTMGVGNYTENDVRESARAFTGWRMTPPKRTGDKTADLANYDPQFIVAAREHDFGSKTFLGQTGNWGGDDIVDIIMRQPATGRFVTTRLFREFANYNPDTATIDRLVKVWDSSGHNVREVVRAILVSDEFYSDESYRALVRSPVDFLVGMVRALEIDSPFLGLDRTARGMDQLLFEPPNVAGWPGGAAWLSSSTFFARVNTLDFLLFSRGRPALPALAAAKTPEAAVDAAAARLIDGNLPPESRDAIATYAATLRNDQERAAAVAYLVLASPEYQLI